MKVSVAIMAHPDREKWAKSLKKELPKGTKTVWDKRNDEWDTASRALMARDPDADWHLVIQDDAILCDNFMAGVKKALAEADEFAPVSFYTGQSEPQIVEVRQVVERCRRNKRPWFTMRGPLWGVAVAIPTSMVRLMVEAIDKSERIHGNYDQLVAEYFSARGIVCWYSNPSLADHRQGQSLVNPSKDQMGRVAYHFLDGDPTEIDWKQGAFHWANVKDRRWRYFGKGFICGECSEEFDRISDILTHHFKEHELGPVDFLASNPESKVMMQGILDRMPPAARGQLWQIGVGGIRPSKVKRVLSRNPSRFTIVDSYKAMKYVIGRNAWSMDNYSAASENDTEVANAVA